MGRRRKVIPMNEFQHLEIQTSQKLKMVETYGERKPLKKSKLQKENREKKVRYLRQVDLRVKKMM